MNLDILVQHVVQHLASRDLQDRALGRKLLEDVAERASVARVVSVERRVEQPGGAVDHALDGVGPRRHLSKLVLDRAKAGDRPAELVALGGVARRFTDGRCRAAAGHHRELEPSVVQGVERDLVPFPDLAEDVVGRHPHVLQNDRRRRRAMQPHLVLFLAGGHAGVGALDQEGGELLAVDLGEYHEQVGEPAVRDPHLLPAEQIAPVLLEGRA